ncbi:MAG: ATP-binding protein [Acidobacteriota bacterium]
MLKLWTRSLRARLVVHFLLLSLLIVALAGYLAFVGARRALEHSVTERLTVTANLNEDQLRRWVASQREDVMFIAAMSEVQRLASAVLDPRAEAGPRDTASAELRELLADSLAIKRSLDEILVLSDVGGQIMISTSREHEGQYRVRDSFYTQGRSRTYVQNVYPSPLEFKPTLTISTPLLDPQGQPVGVLAAHVDLDELDTIIQGSTELDATGEIYIVDRYNDFVSGSRFGRDQYPRGVHTEGIDAAAGGADGSGLYLNYEEVPVLGVYRWIDDLELALIVEVSQREAFAPARRIARVITFIGLGLALLLTAGTILLARQITRPIKRISEASLQVAEGDLSVRAPILTHDEIGVLARSFNKMTERLQSVYDELRQEIRERREAQEELEAKNAELERFTYTVSHDLKSPLVTIKGFLGLLQKNLSQGNLDRADSDIQRVLGAANTMAQLLSELLELSRIGRQVNPSESVDLGELVREAAELVSGAAADCEIVIAPDLPLVLGDRVRLLEVYQNLLTNAAKFMGDQEVPRVEVGAERQADGWRCHVHDNGMGIKVDYHEKIFGLFERLDGSIEGTGIGLALVKRIIEFHGGHIWVESPGEGRGATFFFTLPDVPPELASASASASAER